MRRRKKREKYPMWEKSKFCLIVFNRNGFHRRYYNAYDDMLNDIRWFYYIHNYYQVRAVEYENGLWTTVEKLINSDYNKK